MENKLLSLHVLFIKACMVVYNVVAVFTVSKLEVHHFA